MRCIRSDAAVDQRPKLSDLLKATPTVCHLALAFLIFAKKHKNSSPTVWQFWGVWQIPAEPAHICARPRRLASDVSREKVSSRAPPSSFSAARQARRAALLVSWPAASATSKRTEPARSLPRHSTDTRQHLHATTEPAAYRRFFILFSRGEGIGGYMACP